MNVKRPHLACRHAGLFFGALLCAAACSDASSPEAASPGGQAAAPGAESSPPSAPGSTAGSDGAAGRAPASSAGGGATPANAAGSTGSPASDAGTAGTPGAPGTEAGAAAPSGAAMDMDAAAADASMTDPGSGAGAPCDRACLIEINDAYLAALIANDATQLPASDTLRFTENGKVLQLNEGLWSVARSLNEYRQNFAEVPAGQTAGFASLEDGSGTVLLAFRMKVVDRKVTELETTTCRDGEATFFSPRNLEYNAIYDQEVPAAARLPREEMVEIVDLYFKGIETGDGSAIPFDNGARRNENGSVTGMGTSLQNLAMFSYIEQIDRRYVLVDEERGNVLPWVLFQIPMGFTGSRTLHLAELFKVEGGKIMDIQAIMVNQTLGTPSGWE